MLGKTDSGSRGPGPYCLNERYVFDWTRILFKDPYHIEYSVTDICDRNCRACSHLAPLAKRPGFVGAEEFARVTEQLFRCVPDAHTFWLTGGEPTLHPEFMRLLECARNIFTDSYVGIFTNGSTLKNYAEDTNFWRFVKDNGIVWAVTTYDLPPRHFEALFERHGCLNNLAIVQSGKRFFNITAYSKDRPVSEEKFINCGWERLKLNVRNGRIYNCAAAEFVDLFNAYFGTDIPLSAADFLTVDETLTRARIDGFKHASPFCGNCDLGARHRIVFENAPSKRLMTEWSDLKKGAYND